VLAGEHPAGATESGGDLVADQERAVLVAGFTNPRQVSMWMDDHPRGALHERLEDDRCDSTLLLGQHVFDLGGAGEATVGRS